MQACVEKTEAGRRCFFTELRQPVVYIHVIYPGLGLLNNKEMVVYHTKPFRKNGGDQPENKTGNKDTGQWILRPIAFQFV